MRGQQAPVSHGTQFRSPLSCLTAGRSQDLALSRQHFVSAFSLRIFLILNF